MGGSRSRSEVWSARNRVSRPWIRAIRCVPHSSSGARPNAVVISVVRAMRSASSWASAGETSCPQAVARQGRALNSARVIESPTVSFDASTAHTTRSSNRSRRGNSR